MGFFEKLNNGLFGNVSGKISFLTKLLMIVELVVGIIMILTGIIKFHFFTYISYGLGMTDLSVRTGATYMLIGLCLAIGGWLLGLIILGLNKIIQRAELEEALEEEYWNEFECAECEARDGSCVKVVEEVETFAEAGTETEKAEGEVKNPEPQTEVQKTEVQAEVKNVEPKTEAQAEVKNVEPKTEAQAEVKKTAETEAEK